MKALLDHFQQQQAHCISSMLLHNTPTPQKCSNIDLNLGNQARIPTDVGRCNHFAQKLQLIGELQSIHCSDHVREPLGLTYFEGHHMKVLFWSFPNNNNRHTPISNMLLHYYVSRNYNKTLCLEQFGSGRWRASGTTLQIEEVIREAKKNSKRERRNKTYKVKAAKCR